MNKQKQTQTNHQDATPSTVITRANNTSNRGNIVRNQSLEYRLRRRIRGICSKKTLCRRMPILNWLPNYTKKSAICDLISGITIGLIVIPQALVFAMIAGVPPQYGLYTSFIGCFIYVILGTCEANAVGPSSITAMLIFEAIKQKGPQHAILLCFLTGLIQVLMGFFGFGILVDLISEPVSSGYISAAALVIVPTQMKNLFGIKMSSGPGFLETWSDIIENISHTHLWDAVLGITCILVLILMRGIGKIKIRSSDPEVPLNKFQSFANTTMWSINIASNTILIVVSSCVCYYVYQNEELPFRITGNIPPGLPSVQLPPFSYKTLKNNTLQTETFQDMVTDLGVDILLVPLLGLLESIIICKTFAKGKSLDATQEFFAIGVANILGSFVQAVPCNGAVARSAINHSSGAKTTFGGLYTGILVLLTLVYFTPYLYYIPNATIAAIVVSACIFMVKIEVVKRIWRSKKSDLIPGLAAFVGCLVLPLQYGIFIGIGIDCISVVYHVAKPKISVKKSRSPKGVNYLCLIPDRCLMFPSVRYVKNLVTKYALRHRIPVVIDCSHISGADYTATTMIKTLIEDFSARYQPLFFCNLKISVTSMIDGLALNEFFVYDHLEEFDEILKKWCSKKGSI